ncbi:UDP-N-acetylglucosamine 4-epimerase [Propionicimonas sp. T2.31MG-18]|uniref:NAD-dependent epimerase/dehydratase family protein n=1 Tax=Propionicimonas sp. T2.31MG-18 TaxID=3157620 RepID=UPI0035E7667F
MKLLITGGAGFIGSNLARLAQDQDHEVVIIDDLSTGYRDNLDGLDVDLREASILDASALASALAGVDSVVHLAALGSVPRSIADPMATHHANATGTLAVLQGCHDAGVEHVVVASSSSVYGANPARPKHEREWVRPLSPYAVSKLATEQYALAFQQSFGLSTLAFRFFNVYGPGQRAGHAYAAVIPIFIDKALRGEPLPINGDGLTSRDFTFVGAVCETLLEATGRKVRHPEPVNLAFGTNTSLNELVEELSALLGHPLDVEHHPARPGDVLHSEADSTSLEALFPDIRPTPLRSGLSRTLEWFQER